MYATTCQVQSVPLGGIVTLTAGNLTSLFGFFSPLVSALDRFELLILRLVSLPCCLFTVQASVHA